MLDRDLMTELSLYINVDTVSIHRAPDRYVMLRMTSRTFTCVFAESRPLDYMYISGYNKDNLQGYHSVADYKAEALLFQ